MSRFLKAFVRGFTSSPAEPSVPLCSICGKPAVDAADLASGLWDPILLPSSERGRVSDGMLARGKQERIVRKMEKLTEQLATAKATGRVHDDSKCPGRRPDRVYRA